MEYTLRSTFDLAQVKELKRDEPLRVAAVRDGRVLGSRLVDPAAAKSLDKLVVDVPIDLPPGESPAGVELRIGPEAPAAILPHYDALAIRPTREQVAGEPSSTVGVSDYAAYIAALGAAVLGWRQLQGRRGGRPAAAGRRGLQRLRLRSAVLPVRWRLRYPSGRLEARHQRL
jgi:hypothetical protein